jgi:hypothetical protein
MISCVGAKALGLRGSCSVRLRKKVTWKPSGLPSGVFSQPVTYHHSVRCPGWAPKSCGKASARPGVTGAKAGGPARASRRASTASSTDSKRLSKPSRITSPP